jgi:hypothetical protein
MNNTEVITMQDKAARDKMYADLRANGDELERQVVRFSSYELYVPDDAAIGAGSINEVYANCRYRQTWSIAYPRS